MIRVKRLPFTAHNFWSYAGFVARKMNSAGVPDILNQDVWKFRGLN